MRTNIVNRVKKLENVLSVDNKLPKHIIEKIEELGFTLNYSKKEGCLIVPNKMFSSNSEKYKENRSISSLDELLKKVGYEKEFTGKVDFCSYEKFKPKYMEMKEKLESAFPSVDSSKYRDLVHREIPEAMNGVLKTRP
jgi:hypothetical protein